MMNQSHNQLLGAYWQIYSTVFLLPYQYGKLIPLIVLCHHELQTSTVLPELCFNLRVISFLLASPSCLICTRNV